MRLPFFIIFLLAATTYSLPTIAQSGKFDTPLAKYGITIRIDPKWKRITYQEIKKIKQNIDIDAASQFLPFLAAYIYNPVDSLPFNGKGTEMTIEVYRIADSIKYASLPVSKDTIVSNKPLLAQMKHGFYYYDKLTNSHIIKFRAEVIGESIDGTTLPSYYAVEQTKQVGDNIIIIRYHVAIGQEGAYFDSLEKMISSFK